MTVLALPAGWHDAGHAFLDTAGAVFGLSATDPALPAWLDDDQLVARRVAAKRADALMPEVWSRLAVLAQVCVALARRHGDGPSLARTALRLAAPLAERLPRPPRPLYDRRFDRVPPLADLRITGPRLDHLAVCASELAAALEPGWTDPDALAGTVADTTAALRTYRQSVRLLAGRPAAADPATRLRRPVRGPR